MIESLFQNGVLEAVDVNLYCNNETSRFANQQQVNELYADKWKAFDDTDESNKKRAFDLQKKWYLELYGFKSVQELAACLQGKKVILDAGCGLGYKSAWFAQLSPTSLVIGMDFSKCVSIAAKNYRQQENLFFVQADIADTHLLDDSVDYINCDQVLHHTENPAATLRELIRISKSNAQLALYVYAQKAVPRELLDDYFRIQSSKMTYDELYRMSDQITQLGKVLSELKTQINVPDIPALRIKGGTYDLQRFLYWNFFKCFWNEELGYESSVLTNLDWYSPSNARRYSEDEFRHMIQQNHLQTLFFHQEEACYSGRFLKPIPAYPES